MKIGDLVRSTTPGNVETWVGLIIGMEFGDFIVFWSDKFPDELEYRDQLEVVNERS